MFYELHVVSPMSWHRCYEFDDTWQTEWHKSPLPAASNWNINEHNNFLIRLLKPILHWNHTFELRPSPLVFLVNSFSSLFQLLGMTWLLAIQFQLVSKCKNYSSKRYSTSYILPLGHKILQSQQIQDQIWLCSESEPQIALGVNFRWRSDQVLPKPIN